MLRTILFLGTMSLPAAGQSLNAPTFEVASVRPGQPKPNGMAILCESGRFTVYNDPLKTLIQIAWHLREVQVVGGPGWIGSEGYFVAAKGNELATDAQCRTMIQVLLADRFRLTVHREMRELPVYALVLGKNGPKFRESDVGLRPNLSGGRGRLDVQKVSIANVAQALSSRLGFPVLDRTGLTGRYSFSLEWAPEADQPGVADPDAAPSPSGPSIFTAVQEQLGLRLEDQKGPVEVLVIDHAEKPSEN